MLGEYFSEILFFPVAWLIGYLFLHIKFPDPVKRTAILKRDYADSYARVGLEVTSQFVIGILAIILALSILGVLAEVVYLNFFK